MWNFLYKNEMNKKNVIWKYDGEKLQATFHLLNGKTMLDDKKTINLFDNRYISYHHKCQKFHHCDICQHNSVNFKVSCLSIV
jgi:hypothetical protein